MPGLSLLVQEGKPVVPFRTARILLPPSGAIARVEVSGSGLKDIPGRFELELGRAMQPVSRNDGAADSTEPPNFAQDKPFPGCLHELGPVQKMRGYRVAILRLFPVQYLASEGRVSYYQTLTITIAMSPLEPQTLTPDPGTLTPDPYQMLRGYSEDEAAVAQFVDNPEMLKGYARAEGSGPGVEGRKMPLEGSADPTPGPRTLAPDPCRYLVITASSYASSFQPLVDWKRQKGLTGGVAWVEEIEQSYSGRDLQEKIRNFVRECYKSLGTEYVLLGGDSEIVPHRGMYGEVGDYTDQRMPSDIYYACLDGTFDYDGDGIYGEYGDGEDGGEVDLLAEVYVGRAPVSDPAEVKNFVSKTLQYEVQRSPNLDRALWVGEALDSKTWGCDYKEELVYLLPETFEVTRLYQKQGTFWLGKVISELNSSPHIVNHLGHSTELKLMEMSRSDVESLVNAFPFFVYTQGCDAGAFDYTDSIAEHFVKNQKGAFAMVANSRYGWYSPETTLGTSQTFDREFLYAVFTKGIANLGRALQESKEANIGDVLQTGSTRWCYFQLNLLGDPETPLFTATRKALLRLDRGTYSPKMSVRLKLSDIDLNADPLVTELASLVLQSPGDLEPLFALETTCNSGVFAAEIPLSTGVPALDGVLQVEDRDRITAIYEEADDGTGLSRTVTATAMIDDSPPKVFYVRVTDVRDTWAVIEWYSDEAATARVDFGISPPFSSTTSTDILTNAHRVTVSGLEKETPYLFRTITTDIVGNETIDDNGGAYYSFRTKHQVYIFSDDVEEGSASAAGQWSHRVVSGGVSDWEITTRDCRSGTSCWHCDDYPFPSASVLDSPLIDLRGMTNARLSFWHRMLSETDWDGGFVQVQREGTDDFCSLVQGEMIEGTAFMPLSTGNPSGAVPGWSGNIPWERVTFDLSEYVGYRIRIRFRIESDDNTDVGEGDGWYIDDISVVRAMGTVNLDKSCYKRGDIVSTTVLDGAANTDPLLVETVSVEVSSAQETVPEVIALRETGPDSPFFVGEIPVTTGKAVKDGKIAVIHNDTITVSYGGAEPALATADLIAPTISGLQSTQVSDSFAMIKWTTDELCQGTVYYGTNPAELNRTASQLARASVHQVMLRDLEPRSFYYFKVECYDRAGNVTVDDNGGKLHSFLTLGFSQGGILTQDTVWRYVEGHPYVIAGSLYVGTGNEPNPVTLTIEPGVVVQFKTHRRDLFVRGRILARGVTFEFDLPTGSSAYILLDKDASGTIDNSVISVLGSSQELSGGIECQSSHVEFTNNIVRNAYYGFHCVSCSPKISGNAFIVCKYGVFCHAAPGKYCSPEITGNTHISCTYPILCEAGAYPVVSGNIFDGNGYDGLVHRSIAGDAIWPGYDCPQFITEDVTVLEGTTLRIGPEARVCFAQAGVDLLVSGNLHAERATIEFRVPVEPPTFLIFSPTSSGSIRNCRILGKAPDGGPAGGIKCESSSVSISGNVIYGTSYGVFCGASGSPLIANNTIVACQFGVYAPDASPKITNCILWNNGDDLVGCSGSFLDTMDGDAGQGNISLNPMFVDPTRGDFRLRASSPCIDSGTSEMAPVLDAAGYVRWDDPHAPNRGAGRYPYFDMGACEFVVDADADGVSDEWEIENNLNPADSLDALADSDADGKSNRDEYLSGTDPNDPSSSLRVVSLSATRDEGGGAVIFWQTVTGRSYVVSVAESLSPPRGRRLNSAGNRDAGFFDLTIWKPRSEVIEGTGGVLSFTDSGTSTGTPLPDAFVGTKFYRVEVR